MQTTLQPQAGNSAAWIATHRVSIVRSIAVLLLYWAAASLTTAAFMERWSFREEGDRFDLPRMLEQRAERPFAYRTLVPSAVSYVISLLPVSFKARLAGKLDGGSQLRTRFFKAEGSVAWTPDFSLAYHLIYYLDFTCLLLTLVVLRAIGAQLPGASVLAADFCPLGFCILLPIVFLAGGYFYDFPELLFLALAFLAALRGWCVVLVILVPVAAANKETAILLPLLVSPLLIARSGFRAAAITGVVAMLLGVCVLVAIRILRAGNPGSGIEFHLIDNLLFWLTPTAYLQFTSILAPGIPFPKPQNVLLLGTLATMILCSWRNGLVKEERWTLLLGCAVNLPLLIFFGDRDEIRNLSLAFIPLFMVCIRFFSLALPARSDEGTS